MGKTNTFSIDEIKLISLIKEAFLDYKIPTDKIEFKKLANGSVSIYMDGSLFCKFIILSDGSYLLIKDKHTSAFPDSVFQKRKISSDGMNTRVFIDDSCMPFIKQSIEKIIDKTTIGNVFDCCSLYNECSDAKICVQPDKMRALGCSYRLKLNDSIIFFGKNRNID